MINSPKGTAIVLSCVAAAPPPSDNISSIFFGNHPSPILNSWTVAELTSTSGCRDGSVTTSGQSDLQ